MKKGFTLIELLAVIVILAIIALIATPIVLSIIEETKESAVLRSAEYYLSAVEQSIMKKNLSAGGSFSPNTCEVQSNGILLCDGKDILEIEVNGEVPSSGTITFEKGKIITVELIQANKAITKNEKGQLVLGEAPTSVCKLINDADSSNTITPGDKYQCKVKADIEEGFEDGYYFYVLSQDDDGTTNLILDRNICSDGTLVTSTKSCSVDYDDDEINYTGPYEAMKYLNSATNDWENVSNLDLLYDDEYGSFTDFAITGKARLPYLSEVSNYDGTNGYLYNYLRAECYDANNNPADCEIATEKHGIFEEGFTHLDNEWAYWTLARTNQSDATVVAFEGWVESGYWIMNGAGIRPVINVKL